MELVGLNPEHYNRFPAEFSGGQRQRIGVARALALRPEAGHLRRAGVGARRVDPGADHQPARGPAGRVRPDLRLHLPRPVRGPARQRPDRGDVPRQDRRDRRTPSELFDTTRHPYTRCAAVGRSRCPTRTLADSRERIVLAGDLPSPADPPSGCRFHTRCPKARQRLRRVEPAAGARARRRARPPDGLPPPAARRRGPRARHAPRSRTRSHRRTAQHSAPTGVRRRRMTAGPTALTDLNRRRPAETGSRRRAAGTSRAAARGARVAAAAPRPGGDGLPGRHRADRR